MKQYHSTREVAKLLKLKPDRLQKALWNGVFNSPEKSPSGGYLWTVEDIQRAAWALKRHKQFKLWRAENARQ